MQDYKSLHAAVMICVSLVNTQTHGGLSDYTPANTISSASWAKDHAAGQVIVLMAILTGDVTVTTLQQRKHNMVARMQN